MSFKENTYQQLSITDSFIGLTARKQKALEKSWAKVFAVEDIEKGECGMRLVILGSGGYGHTVTDVAEQLGYECVFLDDAIPNHPLSSFTDYISPDNYFIPAFGNNGFRLEWINKLQNHGATLDTIIHPTAYISPKAKINEGCVVLPHAIINTDTIIEKGCIINLGAIVDHGCVIEEGCHICLGAIIKGENRIERLTKIEAGEVIEARKWPV